MLFLCGANDGRFPGDPLPKLFEAQPIRAIGGHGPSNKSFFEAFKYYLDHKAFDKSNTIQ